VPCLLKVKKEFELGDLTALGDSADNVVVFDVVCVVGLDIDGEAVEGTLNGIFGGGVHHAWLCL
jgi:hypothetical protein